MYAKVNEHSQRDEPTGRVRQPPGRVLDDLQSRAAHEARSFILKSRLVERLAAKIERRVHVNLGIPFSPGLRVGHVDMAAEVLRQVRTGINVMREFVQLEGE